MPLVGLQAVGSRSYHASMLGTLELLLSHAAAGARQRSQLVSGRCLRALIFFCYGWPALGGIPIRSDNGGIPSQQERGLMADNAHGCSSLLGSFLKLLAFILVATCSHIVERACSREV
ncbi:hypothetical protein MTO96_034548 [Rhipicephalus appendiculatus]